mmetsp:Transcript_30649/g.67898  ORF Transcript_30649/g.67898 Transcript_30649/m.67898 type:complete len:262 (+) Transcript_30649:156-941(+)|eukprot:CAMPEP_0202903476 /NCGR_PEP_ID=MMETSP1392-20130828/24632_1 /ASSEMBLY_ACC=CAM_ASM_000868 /TAXON_ID=225041 /ORGANISM="Chlamydomonas chlamydogama, Strain SAG 11-48b" /LENGTH=261 /DNA_ID=CAMNT_0049590675 /DNA_START=147 /DNA_END=932 /DNA_ORIENTATION=+
MSGLAAPLPPVLGQLVKPLHTDYTLVLGAEDVFSFRDASSNQIVGPIFYLDPDLNVTTQILFWLSGVWDDFHVNMEQRPLIITGINKSGKSCTLMQFLPAVIRTWGIKRHAVDGASVRDMCSGQAAASVASLTAPTNKAEGPAAPSTAHAVPSAALPSPNIFTFDGMDFRRCAGLLGFMQDLYEAMLQQAEQMGVEAAKTMPRGHQLAMPQLLLTLRALMQLLPSDTMNFFLLSDPMCLHACLTLAMQLLACFHVSVFCEA